ncbi:psbP-like protein 1, chloroplastic isoform X1 [Brassica napus]|uniref:psbP-like protein 1, chloroplastic isoform X1 n=1 Tax=Brassica napus TaxID=3708 RepID=UPI0006AB31AF|nr:psbP-like protein 1, chloroplastic isoform X1 [Brassica napus]
MASLKLSPSSPISIPKCLLLQSSGIVGRRGVSFLVRAEQSPSSNSDLQDKCQRRRVVVTLGVVAPWISLLSKAPSSFAAESKKGFMTVSDNKDAYAFVYPFGWQEVVIEGQDKVYKDVIEPLESVSVNLIPTSKQNIKDFGPPKEIAETLVKKVLAPPNQKTTLINASEQEVDGKTYYQFEFTAQARNYTRHALGVITVFNGKFYTLTTGANERRWEKMKDRLHTVVDSFKITV